MTRKRLGGAAKEKRTRRFTAIDLFAGCGGLTSGLRAAGFDVLAAVEKDCDAAATYRANHPKVKLYEKDIRTVSPGRLLKALNFPKNRKIDLVAGCPPCQGFTRLTENKGRKDHRNGLVRDFLRFVRILRPKACMLENVPGLLKTRKGKRYFEEIRRGLENAGYRISYDVVELADYGVPQFRKRFVLIGSRHRRISIPSPTHRDPRSKDKSRRRPWRTVCDAIAGLPKPPLRSRVKAGEAEPPYEWHFARDIAKDVRSRLKHAMKNGGSRVGLPDSLRLACHQRHPGGFHDVYGVMDWNAPSPTITSGCTNASKGRFGHPREARPLTAIEAAALQTFTRTYRFKGSGLESVAIQIGNALPRRFAKAAGKAIIERLT